MKTATILIRNLRAGDYIAAAKATVRAVECFAGVAIVEFTDNTATAPLPSSLSVTVRRAA